MAAIVTEAQFARTIEIDGQSVGFTDTDLKMARIHVQKDGQKGPLKKEDLAKWFADGQQEYTLPEPSEKKKAVKADDSNDVTAQLNYRVINAKGQLNKSVHSLDITKGMVRNIRKGLRGRPSAENLLAAILPSIEDTFAPFEIVDANSNVYEVTKDEDGSWTASRSKSGTETVLRERLADAEAKIAEYEATLANRDSE